MRRGAVLAAAAACLLAGVTGCSGGDTIPVDQVRGTFGPKTPGTATPISEAASHRSPAFVTYSHGTHRLTFLDRDLNPTGTQTQLAGAARDVVAAGGLAIAGYATGDLVTINPATGQQRQRSTVSRAGLGSDVADVLLDELLARGRNFLVVGRFVKSGGDLYQGFVQTFDARSLTIQGTEIFPTKVVQDIALDMTGRVQMLFDDGSIGLLGRRGTRPSGASPRPQYFAPQDEKSAAVSTLEEPQTVWPAVGAAVRLPKGSGPGAVTLLPDGSTAVLLQDANEVLIVEASGRQLRIAVPNRPYDAVVDGDRLLVAEADGRELVAISLRTMQVVKRVPLDYGVLVIDRINS